MNASIPGWTLPSSPSQDCRLLGEYDMEFVWLRFVFLLCRHIDWRGRVWSLFEDQNAISSAYRFHHHETISAVLAWVMSLAFSLTWRTIIILLLAEESMKSAAAENHSN
jgi:hypothetical protein